MAKRFWRRRTILIGLIIVALSVGIVFAGLPYLQTRSQPRGTITGQASLTVGGGSSSYPNFKALQIPNITTIETFLVGVSVTNGVASFCVMQYQLYHSWALSYNPSQPSPFPYSNCIPANVASTQQISQGILEFLPTSQGTWAVVVLNSGPSQITVVFSPA